MSEDTTYEQPEAVVGPASPAEAGESEAVETAAETTIEQPDTAQPEQAEAAAPIPFDEIDWSNVDLKGIDRAPADKLPPELARWKARNDRETQELEYYRRQREAARFAQPPAEASKPEPPKRPDPTASQEEWEAYQERLVDFRVEQAVQAKLAPVEQKLSQREAEERRAYYEGLLEYVQGKEGYSPEIDAAMDRIFQEPEFAPLMHSKKGLDAVFKLASAEVGASATQKKMLQRKTTARERVIPRPAGSARDGSPNVEFDNAGDAFLYEWDKAGLPR